MVAKELKPQPYPMTKPVYVESVDLVVRDIDMVSQYYQDIIGLKVLDRTQSGHVLGSGQTPLLTLYHDKNARPSPRKAAGLFHTAFLLPSRQTLANYLKHIVEQNISLSGASDHLVSEALYLSDPEGNGIEIYADRPPEEWDFQEGGVVMDTIALNAHDLLAMASDAPWYKQPDNTVIGHLHLQVGNVTTAEEFYKDVMGLDIMARVPGGSFFASGDYHHHIAANIWHSRGAMAREDGMTGLKGYQLGVVSDEMVRLENTLENLEIPTENMLEKGRKLRDPWGMEIKLHNAG